MAEEVVSVKNSLTLISEEWYEKYKSGWTPDYADDIWHRINKNVLNQIGHMPIANIKPLELLEVLRKITARGALDYAHRALQYCGQVCRYAVATGRAERNVVLDLQGALTPHKSEHHATITTPNEIGELLRAIDGYNGDFITACALKMAPLVFVRPGELRGAEWSEFDLDQAEWRIRAERMKMDDPHIVPLARQTLEILYALKKVTGDGKYLFPSARTDERPMSDNTINAALRRLGYTKEDMTGHGFRSMASTRLNEMNVWNADAIERQLAHGERNKIRAAYNFAEFLPERRRMMHSWSDYLDDLRNNISGNIVMPMRKTAAV